VESPILQLENFFRGNRRQSKNLHHLYRSKVCQIDRHRTGRDSEAGLCGGDRCRKSNAHAGVVDVVAVSLYRVGSTVDSNCHEPSYVLHNCVKFVWHH